jgi:hypothetical protein
MRGGVRTGHTITFLTPPPKYVRFSFLTYQPSSLFKVVVEPRAISTHFLHICSSLAKMFLLARLIL